MNKRRGLIVLMAPTCAIALAAALVGADTDNSWKVPARATRKQNPVPSDGQAIAAGKTLYADNCLSCHGAIGRADGSAAKDLEKNPPDLSKPVMWDETDGALFWKITQGKKPMPSFEELTSETERWQIVDYVRTLAPKPASSEPAK